MERPIQTLKQIKQINFDYYAARTWPSKTVSSWRTSTRSPRWNSCMPWTYSRYTRKTTQPSWGLGK